MAGGDAGQQPLKGLLLGGGKQDRLLLLFHGFQIDKVGTRARAPALMHIGQVVGWELRQRESSGKQALRHRVAIVTEMVVLIAQRAASFPKMTVSKILPRVSGSYKSPLH